MKAWRNAQNEKICPVCGARYSYIERRRTKHNVYIYFVHIYFEGRRRRVKKCYAGAEKCYKYVERTHFDIAPMFRGLHDEKRAIDYLERLVDFLESNAESYDVETLKDMRARLEGFLSYLDAVIYNLENQE